MRSQTRARWSLGGACTLAGFAALARCETKRTEVVLWVETSATQGLGGSGGSPRLVGLRSAVFWGPAPGPMTIVPGRDAYDTEVEPGPPKRAPRQRVGLPFPLFAVETRSPDAFRWVRLEVFVRARFADQQERRIGPFTMNAAFWDGVTRHEVLLIDRACIEDGGARVARCNAMGLTCGANGDCESAVRPPGPPMLRPPPYEPCDGGFCATDGASAPGSDGGLSGDAPGDDLGDDLGDASGDGLGTPSCSDAAPGCDADDARPGDAPRPTNPPPSVESVFVCERVAGLEAGCTPDLAPDPTNNQMAGGACDGIPGAYTKRGVNVGYYPFRLLRSVAFVYDGGAPIGAGEAPRGALVALASTPSNYDAARCQDSGTSVAPCCGAGYCQSGASACETDSPPLRAGIPVTRALPDGRREVTAYAFWGYVVVAAGGAPANVFGWFLLDDQAAVYVGDLSEGRGPAHGPEGNEFEVASCGRAPRSCRVAVSALARARTCGSVNRCDEGGGDCQRCPDGGCRRRLDPTANVSEVARASVPASEWGPVLRWAPDSSPRGWLRWGDEVRVHYRNYNRQGEWWVFVEVTRAPGRSGFSLTPVGAVGWMRGEHLANRRILTEGVTGCGL